MKVSLFVTCLADQFYPAAGIAAVRLLRRFGCQVDFPANQTCCGQPAFNAGYVREARRVASTLLDAFDSAEYIVTPSGSCAGMIHHYYRELFSDSPFPSDARAVPGERPVVRADAARAEAMIAKTYEFAQFLVRVLGVEDVGARAPHTVTYHPSCHGSRLLGVTDEPLTLLQNVKDIALVPLPKSQDCCGFGGTFAVKLSDISGAMVAEKVDRIVETGAEFVVSGDAGCLMNISGHIRKRGLPITPIHLAEFLDRFSGE